jgi:hypothetical protein
MFRSTEQRAASRSNSQKSTGSRTAAGKAVSRFTALKHGIYAVHQIMFDEKPEDLADLSAEYHEHHRPADPDRRLLIDTLVHNEWRFRRVRRVEAELWQTPCNTFIVKISRSPQSSICTSGDAFATDSSTLPCERLQRVVNSCERVYHRAFKELQRPQAEAKVGQALPHANPGPLPQPPEPVATPAPPPQPEQSKPTSESSASVRYKSETPASAAPNPLSPRRFPLRTHRKVLSPQPLRLRVSASKTPPSRPKPHEASCRAILGRHRRPTQSPSLRYTHPQ